MLTATADLLEAAKQELNGSDAPIRICVTEIRQDSLEVFFDFVPYVYDSAVDALTSKDLTALRTLIELLFGANGLIWLIKKLGRRRQHRNQQVQELEPDIIEALRNQRLVRLLQNPEIRAAISRLINRLLTEMEIQIFKARHNRVTQVVEKHEAVLFSRDTLDSLAAQVQILAQTSTSRPTEEPGTGMSGGNHEPPPEPAP